MLASRAFHVCEKEFNNPDPILFALFSLQIETHDEHFWRVRGPIFEFRFVENGISQTKTEGPFWNPHFVEYDNILVLEDQNGGFVLVPRFACLWVWLS